MKSAFDDDEEYRTMYGIDGKYDRGATPSYFFTLDLITQSEGKEKAEQWQAIVLNNASMRKRYNLAWEFFYDELNESAYSSAAGRNMVRVSHTDFIKRVIKLQTPRGRLEVWNELLEDLERHRNEISEEKFTHIRNLLPQVFANMVMSAGLLRAYIGKKWAMDNAVVKYHFGLR